MSDVLTATHPMYAEAVPTLDTEADHQLPTVEEVLRSAGHDVARLSAEAILAGATFPDDLFWFGFGGGRGPDGDPLQATPRAFKRNMVRMGKDVCGSTSVTRIDCVATYNQTAAGGKPADTWGPWNFGQVDELVAEATAAGRYVLINVHVQGSKAANTVPKVTVVNGVPTMVSWKNKLNEVFAKYALNPTVMGIENWNEPNQIGYSAGALAQGGSNQGYSWDKLNYFMARDLYNAARAHSTWANRRYKLSGLCMGGLEPDWIGPILQYGTSQGFDWGVFDALSMHCYVKADPMVAQGGASNRGVLDTIRTHIRPLMNSNGAGPATVKIWITEGGTGGSLLRSGVELVNAYQGAGTGHAKADTFWGHMFGDSGMDPDQTSGQLSQPFIIRNYMRKLRSLNTVNNAGVEMMVLHMFIRTGPLTNTDATSNDYVYWQKARCFSELPGADTDGNAYTAATGTPLRSPDWLPVARVYYDERIAGASTPVAPSNVTLPTVSDATPVVGQTLTAAEGGWNGVPTPSFQFEWIRGASTVIASGQTYVVTNTDLGSTLKVRVTATNASGTAQATSAATAAVGTGGTGVPTNTLAPHLDMNGAPVSTSNPPKVGIQLTIDPGQYSPAATGYNYGWEKTNDGGATTVPL